MNADETRNALKRVFDGGLQVVFGSEAFEAFDLLAGAVEDQRDGEHDPGYTACRKASLPRATGKSIGCFLRKGGCGGPSSSMAMPSTATPWAAKSLWSLLKLGISSNAGDAPGGPEVDHHDLAGERGGVDRAPPSSVGDRQAGERAVPRSCGDYGAAAGAGARPCSRMPDTPPHRASSRRRWRAPSHRGREWRRRGSTTVLNFD